MTGGPAPQPAPPPPRRAGADRLIALFLFGVVAFNPPLLRVFGAGDTLFGLPLLYVYALGVWGGVIALSAVLLERRGR
ncbi:hypothetical protein FBZ82_107108 [Azospirillum brasilense]|uniref:DUF3311 domain-containing protein n=1 Tax=Azospirillum brasilense TaxID=192 RepID=A0A560APV3_AZOBR|nr:MULTISPECIES: hypothetical protein [Azospirillum]MBB3267401.1 hypothetical protein [Azospirillum sp. OGB3]TWA62378.1 hypothetical protein FBZ84_111154 [Azospirillum baldaniorum]TWA67136.1 hypothetical protein FBZ82_107108 [Azospirillum brasilense]